MSIEPQVTLTVATGILLFSFLILAAGPSRPWSEGRALLKVRRRWWLGPIVVMIALLVLLVFISQGTVVAPFIYSLF